MRIPFISCLCAIAFRSSKAIFFLNCKRRYLSCDMKNNITLFDQSQRLRNQVETNTSQRYGKEESGVYFRNDIYPLPITHNLYVDGLLCGN
jgi:hypothetical protein